MSEFDSVPIPAPELSRREPATATDQEACARVEVPSSAMTLRDYFAGHALSAIVMGDLHATRYEAESMALAYARKAFEFADAMMRVREEQGRD